MPRFVLLFFTLLPLWQTPPTRLVDVSAVVVGKSTTIAELDLGKLKGDLRRLSWSADGSELCIMTADSDLPDSKTHFYTVAITGGAITPIDREPAWATEYWSMKSYKSAPGIDALTID